MHDSKNAACPAATTPLTTKRLYYTIRAEGGFLAASHAIDGPPIVTCADPARATRFIDVNTAGRRAAALQLLGWRDLRITAVYL